MTVYLKDGNSIKVKNGAIGTNNLSLVFIGTSGIVQIVPVLKVSEITLD